MVIILSNQTIINNLPTTSVEYIRYKFTRITI